MLGDLNELKTFQRVLTLGSLSAAGRDLDVGLAVVSKRLASLERRAGVRLINRTTRRLSPTSEGLALLADVERMLEALADAEAALASGREAPQGVLRVAGPISLGRAHLAPVAAALMRAHPGLEVELRLSDRLIDLIEERIDVAVRNGQPRDSSAVMRLLVQDRRILLAAPAYLDRRGRPASPEELEGHDWVRWGEASLLRLEGPGGRTVELRPHARLRCDNGDVVHDWAVAGEGLSVKSAVEAAEALRSGAVERVLPDWQSAGAPIYALLPTARQMAPKTRAFIEALAARLKGV